MVAPGLRSFNFPSGMGWKKARVFDGGLLFLFNRWDSRHLHARVCVGCEACDNLGIAFIKAHGFLAHLVTFDIQSSLKIAEFPLEKQSHDPLSRAAEISSLDHLISTIVASLLSIIIL